MQYYQTMIVPGTRAESIQEEDGSIHPQAPSEAYEQACRYEPSDRERETPTADGISVKYHGVIYMPVTAPRISVNVQIEIPGIVKANVKYFKRGLMNCSIFI